MTATDPRTKTETINRRITQIAWGVIGLLLVYVVAMTVRWQPPVANQDSQHPSTAAETSALEEQIHPKDGYNLSVSYGRLGPELLASGIIDYDAFAAIYQNAGTPLSEGQIETLKKGSDQEIVINSQAAKYINAYWFPQQTLEAALYLQANQGIDFVDADPRLVVGRSMASASGAQLVHADLESKGILLQANGQGGSCSN